MGTEKLVGPSGLQNVDLFVGPDSVAVLLSQSQKQWTAKVKCLGWGGSLRSVLLAYAWDGDPRGLIIDFHPDEINPGTFNPDPISFREGRCRGGALLPGEDTSAP